jgi:FKBP-type peptidyl-prolyl cis-trans isomerase
MKLIMLRLLLTSALLLGGCGEDPEREAFRHQLVEKALNDDTRRAGAAFLAENQKRTGVIVLASGLQYRVLKSGSGEYPTFQHSVVVHYEGTRVDGGIFDSSYQREKPSVFPLQRVIKGWQQALLKMKVGDIWMLYVPPELAYGATSPSEAIPANSTLIFKVELLEVRTNEGAGNEE